MELKRRIRYYYLRFVRIKGEPHDLSLGITFGIFVGMLPIIPFHMAFAVALALAFRASKITAILGVWVSNPFDWYLLYYLNYKLGAKILGLSGDNPVFSSIMQSIQRGEEGMVIVQKIAHAGSTVIGAFLIGGLIMGVVAAIPSYFIFLWVFGRIGSWREKRMELKRWQRENQ